MIDIKDPSLTFEQLKVICNEEELKEYWLSLKTVSLLIIGDGEQYPIDFIFEFVNKINNDFYELALLAALTRCGENLRMAIIRSSGWLDFCNKYGIFLLKNKANSEKLDQYVNENLKLI